MQAGLFKLSFTVELLYMCATSCFLFHKGCELYSRVWIKIKKKQTWSLQLLLLCVTTSMTYKNCIEHKSQRGLPYRLHQWALSPRTGSFFTGQVLFFTFPPWNKWSIWQAAKRRTAPCSWREQIWGFPWMSGGSGWTRDPHPEAPAVSLACDHFESGVPCSHHDPFCKHTYVRTKLQHVMYLSICIRGANWFDYSLIGAEEEAASSQDHC